MHAMRRLSLDRSRQVMHAMHSGAWPDDSADDAVTVFTETDTVQTRVADIVAHVGSLALQAARAFTDDNSAVNEQRLFLVDLGDVGGIVAWIVQATPRDGLLLLPILAAVQPGIVLVDLVVPVSAETVHCQIDPPMLTFHPRLMAHNCHHLLTRVPLHQWAATFGVPPGDRVPAPASTLDFSLPAQLLLPVTAPNITRIGRAVASVLFGSANATVEELCAAENTCLFEFIVHGRAEPSRVAIQPEQLARLLDAFVPVNRCETLATWPPGLVVEHPAACEMLAMP